MKPLSTINHLSANAVEQTDWWISISEISYQLRELQPYSCSEGVSCQSNHRGRLRGNHASGSEREKTQRTTHTFVIQIDSFKCLKQNQFHCISVLEPTLQCPCPHPEKYPNKDIRLINIADAVRCISLLCNITISSLFSFPLAWVSFLLSHGGAPVILHCCLSSLSPLAPRSLLYAAILRVVRTVCISVCGP